MTRPTNIPDTVRSEAAAFSSSAMLRWLLGDEHEAPRTETPAVLVVAAHPDDEVIGLGTRLPRLRHAEFLHVTDGAPRAESALREHGFASHTAYAAARRAELDAALAAAGIPDAARRELGCSDQEASLHLAPLARSVAAITRELRPDAVITHPYEGGHPDHDATAFAVHAAAALLACDGECPPLLLEMTSYHLGPAGIEPSCFIPGNVPEHAGGAPAEVLLDEKQRSFKQRLLDCFTTQRETLRYFPPDAERFRAAPRYRFSEPPHAGTLLYEMHPWGMTGYRFRGLARRALDELGLSEPL